MPSPSIALLCRRNNSDATVRCGDPFPYGLILDDVCNPSFIEAVESIRLGLPLDSKRPTVDRRFYVDENKVIVSELEQILRDTIDILLKSRTETLLADVKASSNETLPEEDFRSVFIHCNKYIRILEYSTPGTGLPPHTDGTKVCEVTQIHSTHTLLLYLSDCRVGGETVILDGTTGWSKQNEVSVPVDRIYQSTKSTNAPLVQQINLPASCCDEHPSNDANRHHVSLGISPRRGRMFVMPHAWPHAGATCVSVPKIMLRAEVTMTWK